MNAHSIKTICFVTIVGLSLVVFGPSVYFERVDELSKNAKPNSKSAETLFQTHSLVKRDLIKELQLLRMHNIRRMRDTSVLDRSKLQRTTDIKTSLESHLTSNKSNQLIVDKQNLVNHWETNFAHSSHNK